MVTLYISGMIKMPKKFLDQLNKPGKYSIYYILGKRNNIRMVMPISRTDIIYNKISLAKCEKKCLDDEECKGIVTQDDGTCVKCTGDNIEFKNSDESRGSLKVVSENNLVCRIPNPPTIKKTYIGRKKYVPGFVNSYTLKDMFGNVMAKKGKQRTDSKPFTLSCKPGFITSYKFNDDQSDSLSDKTSIGKVKCSTDKFLNRYYGGGKKVVLKKGVLLTDKDKKNTYFKPNKTWKYNDNRDKGIGNHNYCRQTPTPDSKKGNLDPTTKNDFPHPLGLPTQDNG